jgi:protein subunit release factor B
MNIPKHKMLLFSVTKKDLDVQTFRSGGKGGQNQNKVESGVRIIHRASGAVGESREYRDQPQNKKAAFQRMIKTSSRSDKRDS